MMKFRTIGEKIGNFCAFRERCTKEVVEKLGKLGCNEAEQQEWLTKLIDQGFLDDQRFASLYARSKFNQKKWGRLKIVANLKQKSISEDQVRRAMKEIDEDEYLSVLKALASRKYALLGPNNGRRDKTYRFLVHRGFEIDRIIPILNGLDRSLTSK